MKAHLEYRIPDEDYDVLRLLLGRPLGTLVFQQSCGSCERIVASMIAVPLKNEDFVRFTTDDWGDTSEFAIDCFRMRVQRVRDPAYSYYEATKEPVEIELIPISSPGAPVKRIEVLGFTDRELGDGIEESVAYDAGILLHRADATPILIHADSSSIAGDVGLLENGEEITEALERYERRSEIEEQNKPMDSNG